jgi:hypothetical protein
MATWIATPGLALLGRRGPALPQDGVSRRRRSLAGTIEISLERSTVQRHALNYWPRIPHENRVALAEPMQQIVSLLRDPAIAFTDDALARILTLATHPASPAYGPYPIQARFAAYSLLDELGANEDRSLA